MTTHTSGAADLPEALRLANILDLLAMDMKTPRLAAAELRRLHALTVQAISAEPAAHVQNPAENEHVADDMSKNETGSNTAYAALERGSPVVAGEPWGASVGDRVWVGKLPAHVPKLAEAEGLSIQWLYATPQPTQAQAGAVLDLNAAAKKLAERMDYPWEHMPEQGRAEMRKHALAVINAARGIKEGGQHV